MSQPIRGQGSHLFFFQSAQKNTNLVEGIEILLPIKFRWIPFSGFSEEVENVSANQRPRRPFCFSNRPEKHKLDRVRWGLASCQVLLNSVQWFQRRSRKCLSQSEARAAILFFRSARKTQTWKRALRSCFLSSFVEFCSAVSEEKLKMWKLTTTGRRTDDGHTFGSGALIRTEFYINTKMFKKHITSSGHCIGFDCFVDLFRLNYSLVISQLGSRRYSISETYWRDLSLLGHCSLYRIIRNCIANMYTSFNSFEFNFLLNVILQISIISLCKVYLSKVLTERFSIL